MLKHQKNKNKNVTSIFTQHTSFSSLSTMNTHIKKQKVNHYMYHTSVSSLCIAASLFFALIKRKIFRTSGTVRKIFSIKAAQLNMLDKLTKGNS